MFMTESRGPAELVQMFGGYAGYDFYVDGRVRIYTSNGELSISSKYKDEFRIKYKLTKEKNPEYFL
jgi:hypothetical protein